MKNYHFFAIAFLVFISFGCGSGPGTPVEYAKACAAENDKKNIEVSGFFDDSKSVFCSNTGGGPVRCGFGLKETKESERISLSADIERGSGANEVEELKSGYKKEDIKIHTNDGSIFNLGDKVKITGILNVVPGSERCYITVSKIEK